MIYSYKFYEDFHKRRYKGLIPIPTEKDFSYKLILPFIAKLLKKDQEILDIGCGNGALSFFAAKQGCKVLGVDISKKAILGCRLNARRLGLNNIRFKSKSFDQLTVKEIGKFDLAICSEVLEHLPEDFQVLRKIYSLLQPGGTLFLSTPSVNSPIHIMRMIFFKKDSFDEEVGHLRRYDIGQLVSILKKANYKIMEVYKTEGILRNFFFVTEIGTKLQRMLKPGIRELVAYLDNKLLFLGESDLVVIASKPK